MIYPKGVDIYKLIENLVYSNKDIKIISIGVVMHMEVMGTDFYIYSKCVTYAGKPYPLNTTRAQLPKRDEFETIKTGSNVFLFLGFDVENNVFVCWDPCITKERLNKKSYVSFFSRLNLQQSVEKGCITTATLQNDFKYVLFKCEDLCSFLLNIQKYFTGVKTETPIVAINEKVQGYLSSVEDDVSVKLFIDEICEMDETAGILSVVSGCFNEFGEFYHKMKLKDWYSIVNEYLTNKDSVFYYGNVEPEEEENEIEENKVKYDEIDEESEQHNVADNSLVQGWTMDVLKCVEQIPNDVFRLEDVYAFADVLQTKYPNNKTIKASIRQKLQILRDKGYIEFVGNGKYRKLNDKSFLHYSERIINLKQAKIRGEVIVAKPVLLLALIDGIDQGVFGSNRFVLNEWLERRYNSLMLKYTVGSQFDTPTGIEKPFWHLASDGFWHLQCSEEPKEGMSPSSRWLKVNVEFARFDDDLWILLQNRESRLRMRNFIVEKKLIRD